MDSILISDLEVHYHVGVPDEERVHPQRLLLSVEMDHDFARAAAADDLTHTVNYFAVSQHLLTFGRDRHWKLIETLAVDIANSVMKEFKPAKVRVQVKKFIIPEAGFVAVRVERGPGKPPETARERVIRQIGGVPGGLR